ncbi:MAG: NAD-dependent epimerase/dehydratase family protein [Myxococcota bacterium]|nr:NAD-dependent epimerase/dehydratase family protein [Myxococcota bacterium]
MHKVVILGGTGFIGRHLSDILFGECERILISRHPPGSELHSINWLQGDYCDPHLKIPDCDWIIHLATPSHPSLCSDSPTSTLEKYGLAFKRLLKKMPSKSRMIYVSSIHVYSQGNLQPMNEDDLAEPMHLYGQIKRQDEHILLHAQKGIIVRPSQLYGFPPPPRSILSDWQSQMCNPDLSVIKVGNLKLERDFLHVRDACLAIRQLIFSPQKHLIFNVSSGTGVALSEIANALGILDKCQQDKLRFRQDEQITWVADNTRMIKTGWKVTTNVIDELKKMWV